MDDDDKYDAEEEAQSVLLCSINFSKYYFVQIMS